MTPIISVYAPESVEHNWASARVAGLGRPRRGHCSSGSAVQIATLIRTDTEKKGERQRSEICASVVFTHGGSR